MTKTSKAKRSVSEWRLLVAECEASGMTQRDWCIANNINFYTFADRARRLRQMDEEGAEVPLFRNKRSDWVEVKEQITEAQEGYDKQASIEVASNEKSPEEIRIVVGKYTISVMNGFDETALVRVLSALTSTDDVRGARR